MKNTMQPMYLGLIALVAVVGVAAWSYSKQNGMYTTPTPTPEVVLVEAGEKSIVLSEQNESGQTGVASITENDAGMAVVTLTMAGGEFDKPQPAHIHTGSCPTPGAVKYALKNVVDGMSETTLTVTYDALMAATEKMAINVHKSAVEPNFYTACGNVN